MALHFDPSTASWFVELDQGIWRVPGRTAPLILAGYLSLSPEEDTDAQALQEACKGDVKVRPEGAETCTLLFDPVSEDDAAEPVELTVEDTPLVFSNWQSGRYRDGWLADRARLEIEGADRLGLRLFLPKRDELGDKALIVRQGGRMLGEFALTRGKPQELWLELGIAATEVAVIEFEFETAEPVNEADPRRLGCVLREVNVTDTWHDAAALG
jgi:hypothetical protein